MQPPKPESPEPKTPLWETLVIAASFAGVWIYFLARISAGRANTPLSPAWQFLLLPALLALFFVFKRRFVRTRNALKDAGSQNSFPPFMPPAPRSENSKTKKR